MPRKYQRLFSLSNEHTKGITAVAFSPRGTFVATGGLDGKVGWWRVEDGKLLYVWCGNSAVLSLAWVPGEESSILCGFQDGNLAVVRVTMNTLYINGFWAHKYPVERIAIDGGRVATGAHKELKVWNWDVDTYHFSLVQTLPEPPKTSHNKEKEVLITSLHWATQQGRHLIMATYLYHGAQFFDPCTGEMTRTFPIPGMIASASLSPSGANLVVSNIFKGFDVYRVQSEEPVVSFEHIDMLVTVPACPLPVTFVHGGHALVGGSMTGKVGLWDLGMGKMHSLVLNKGCKVLAVDAHDRVSGDNSSNRFWIATGITNEEGMSSCIIWGAEELGTVGAQTSDKRTDAGNFRDVRTETHPSAMSPNGVASFITQLVWAAAIFLAVAYILNGPWPIAEDD